MSQVYYTRSGGQERISREVTDFIVGFLFSSGCVVHAQDDRSDVEADLRGRVTPFVEAFVGLTFDAREEVMRSLRASDDPNDRNVKSDLALMAWSEYRESRRAESDDVVSQSARSFVTSLSHRLGGQVVMEALGQPDSDEPPAQVLAQAVIDEIESLVNALAERSTISVTYMRGGSRELTDAYFEVLPNGDKRAVNFNRFRELMSLPGDDIVSVSTTALASPSNGTQSRRSEHEGLFFTTRDGGMYVLTQGKDGVDVPTRVTVPPQDVGTPDVVIARTRTAISERAPSAVVTVDEGDQVDAQMLARDLPRIVRKDDVLRAIRQAVVRAYPEVARKTSSHEIGPFSDPVGPVRGVSGDPTPEEIASAASAVPEEKRGPLTYSRYRISKTQTGESVAVPVETPPIEQMMPAGDSEKTHKFAMAVIKASIESQDRNSVLLADEREEIERQLSAEGEAASPEIRELAAALEAAHTGLFGRVVAPGVRQLQLRRHSAAGAVTPDSPEVRLRREAIVKEEALRAAGERAKRQRRSPTQDEIEAEAASIRTNAERMERITYRAIEDAKTQRTSPDVFSPHAKITGQGEYEEAFRLAKSKVSGVTDEARRRAVVAREAMQRMRCESGRVEVDAKPITVRGRTGYLTPARITLVTQAGRVDIPEASVLTKVPVGKIAIFKMRPAAFNSLLTQLTGFFTPAFQTDIDENDPSTREVVRSFLRKK